MFQDIPVKKDLPKKSLIILLSLPFSFKKKKENSKREKGQFI